MLIIYMDETIKDRRVAFFSVARKDEQKVAKFWQKVAKKVAKTNFLPQFHMKSIQIRYK